MRGAASDYTGGEANLYFARLTLGYRARDGRGLGFGLGMGERRRGKGIRRGNGCLWR